MSPRTRVLVLVGVVTLVYAQGSVAVPVSAAEKIGKPHQPISAVIVRSGEYTEEGISHTTAINILDRDIIKKLEAFFPDYDRSPSSKKPPMGWEEGYCVYFNFGDGKTIEVVVAMEGQIWSMGHGDLVINGNFAKFVKDLESRKAPKKRK
jgi:hypothetical protein